MLYYYKKNGEIIMSFKLVPCLIDGKTEQQLINLNEVETITPHDTKKDEGKQCSVQLKSGRVLTVLKNANELLGLLQEKEVSSKKKEILCD